MAVNRAGVHLHHSHKLNMKILGEFNLKKDITTNEFVAIVVKEELDKGDEGEAVKVGDYYIAEMHIAGTAKKWFIFDEDFTLIKPDRQTHFRTRQIAITKAVDMMIGKARMAVRKHYNKS